MSPLAVAVVHGVGTHSPDFADPVEQALLDHFAEEASVGEDEAREALAIEPVHWAPVLEEAEREIWRRLSGTAALDFSRLRRFVIDFLGDAIAYEPTLHDRSVYDAVHATFARTLHALAERAGTAAPLFVVAHSLGSVIASNYLYDLGRIDDTDPPGFLGSTVREHIDDTPLERGDTLAGLFTLGSPLALWALHHRDFGRPVAVPSPELKHRFPGLECGWVNFYDEDDVLAYPLRPLNAAYAAAVREDRAVAVGGAVSGWSPLSHQGYWTDPDVVRPIARELVGAWRAIERSADR